MSSGSGAFTCEQCAAQFSGLEGGICSRCGRMLCGRHLHGWVGQLLRPWLGADPVCVTCRRGERPAPERPTG